MKRLRFVARLNPPVSGFGPADQGEVVSFLPLESVWSDERFDPSRTVEFSGDVQSYNAVSEGDLLVPKVSPTFAHGRTAIARGLYGGRALATSEVFVLRPHDRDATRYLQYRLLAADFLREGQASWFGVAGLKRVSAAFIKDTRIPETAWQNRVAIADFLDAETSRIAGVRREIAALLPARASSSGRVSALLAARGVALSSADPEDFGDLPEGWRAPLLGRVLRQLTNGFVGPTRDILVEDGVPYIQSTHIKDGRIDFFRRPFFVTREWHDERPRISLREGDVLIVQTGKLGETALVPAGFGPASCHALLIARVDPVLVSAEYLAAWFQSHAGRAALMRSATGALHPHLEAGEIRKVRMMLPTKDVQALFVECADQDRAERDAFTDELGALDRELEEYRSALITKAVTGGLDLAKLSDARMEENIHAVREGESPEVLAS
ncbi:hypothetical protein [Conexibacter sp. SYSU D00693]|uniref:hypothetical protein n=1 Tax=Conexibacter sp. SYSU D00693 TaxID=2812560 RepID=UPI00196A4BDF|nr:hypothetical protein [Conexibacter sp. SYSU D00693]